MQSFVPVTIKLCILPVMVYLMMSKIMNVPGLWVEVTTLAACMPAGVNSYNIAVQYNTGVKRVASTILLGTVLSTITLMIAVSVL